MASVKDVLLRFIGQDMVSPVQNRIRRGMNDMETAGTRAGNTVQSTFQRGANGATVWGKEVEKNTGRFKEMAGVAGMALTAIGAGTAFFLLSTIPAANAAQQAWERYAASLGMNYDQWNANKEKYMSGLNDMVNRTGRSLGSLRDAEAGLSRFGVSHDQFMGKTGDIVAGIAAYKMVDLNTAAENYGMAIEGNKRSLIQLGLTFEDLGSSSKEWTTLSNEERQSRLNAALESKNYMQQEKNYAESNAAKIAVLQARWEGVKAKIGTVVVAGLLPLVNILSQAMDWFNKLPQPIQDATGYALVFGTAIALIAGPILMLIGALPMLAEGLAVMEGLPLIGGLVSAITGGGGLMAAITGLVGGVGGLGATLIEVLTGPPGWILLIITAVIAAITYFGKWGDVMNALGGAFNVLKGAGNAAFGGLLYVAQAIGGTIGWLYGLFSNLMNLFVFGKGNPMSDTEVFIAGLVAPFMIIFWLVQNFQRLIGEVQAKWDGFVKSKDGQAMFKELGDAIGTLMQAWNQLYPALQYLYVALFGVGQAANGPTGAGGAMRQVSSDVNLVNTIVWILIGGLRVAIIIIQSVAWFLGALGNTFKAVGDFVNWVRGGVDWLNNSINGLITTVQNAIGWLGQFISAGQQAGGIQVNGQPTVTSGAGPGITPGSPADNAGKWLQGAAGNTAAWFSGGWNALTKRFHSPLTLQSGNVPLMRFPEITPAFAEGIKSFNNINKTSSNSVNVGGVSIQINGARMNTLELAKALMDVFDFVEKGQVPPNASRGG